jgi:adenylate cyclase
MQTSYALDTSVTNRIVVTGGPLGGKSYTLNFLQNTYGHKARFMSEVASMLLASGYPQPGRDLEYSEKWLDYINRVIIPTQKSMEEGHLHAAELSGAHAMFFDRGLLDPAAYMAGGRTVLQDRYGLNIEEVMDRYTMVIHLESIACKDKHLYDELCGTNPSRYDTADQAIERDMALREAWAGHPNWVFIESNGVMDDGILARVLAVVSPILDIEIERKWLLNKDNPLLAAVLKEHVLQAETIHQHYLHHSPTGELRLRMTNEKKFEITAKSKGGKTRTEWERAIPESIYHMLVEHGDLPSISKMRIKIPHGNLTLEVDLYLSKLSSLMTMECEAPSEAIADALVLPDWAEGAIDVTDDPAYKNVNLALYGLDALPFRGGRLNAPTEQGELLEALLET